MAERPEQTRESGDSEPKRMARPARADQFTVSDILRYAGEGRLRLPAFQRPLRWESSDKRQLVDSIERGFPIGTLLLWKRSVSDLEEDAGRALAGAPELPSRGDVYLVVDGQQRITTLWDALGRRPESGQVLGFELPRGEFRFRPMSRAELEAQQSQGGDSDVFMPLYVVGDATSQLEWMPQGLARESKTRLLEVGSRLRDYKIAVYIVEGDDLETLREVFDRTNRTGKHLTREEVFDALVGSKVGGLDRVNTDLADLGFGTLTGKTVLNAFEAISGAKIGKLDPRSVDATEARSHLRRLGKAFDQAIRFLREAGMPHVELVPYELAIVVLAKLFDAFPDPRDRSRVLLRRWLWRGSIAGKLGGASGSLQSYADDVVAGDEHGSVQRLLARLGNVEESKRSLAWPERFSAANAVGQLHICAVLHARPRHLRTGELLGVAELFSEGLDGVCRRIIDQPEAEASSARGFENRLLHPAAGANPARLIAECDDVAALTSHHIDRDAHLALRSDDADGFLRSRRALVSSYVLRFFERQAEWGRDDAPPVTELARAVGSP
jgi:hypothetical protein